MNRTQFRWVLLLLVLALGACAAAKKDDGLRARVFHYASAIRWNEFEQALKFIDPAVLEQKPFDEKLAARWKQVQVARYFEGPQTVDAEGRMTQTVQIELVDRSTQTVRNIVDRQRWRFDPVAGLWWLESGLPDLEQAPR